MRLTWGNHYWSAIGSALNVGLDPGDRWLCCLPLNHVGGLSILLRSVLYGNTVAQLHRRFLPEAINTAIHERGAGIVSVVANMLQRMLDANGDRPYPSSLRAILVGGGSTPEALIERCRRRNVPILLTYGLSETASQVATERPGDTASCGVGQPLAFAEVRVVDDDGRTTPPGTHGQIAVRGPIVSPGYLGEVERRDDEWLHTRDLGWLDQRGYLHVLGRGDDTIVCGGENVHPREVEHALEAHPAVAEAFANGSPRPTLGKSAARRRASRRRKRRGRSSPNTAAPDSPGTRFHAGSRSWKISHAPQPARSPAKRPNCCLEPPMNADQRGFARADLRSPA